ncbi:MAG: DinB family protein [Armatimonadetes bacterium]|nr:DinB family protein [Armatimonadota bacterium]
MLPAYALRYLLSSLEGTPSVLSALLAGIPTDSPVWDARPDPDRFSLREILAHLADWEPVAHERIVRTATETAPFLPNWDEEKAVLVGDYAHSEPHESLRLFTISRGVTVHTLASLAEADWSRVARREGVGELTIERQAFLMLAHDGYHLRQVVEQVKSGIL